jgi:serine/threonine protein kinase
MAREIPEKLGKYSIIEEIARGSMGVVYLGHDPFIDRHVAVKVALAEQLQDGSTGERYRKMFFNEAHTAGMLRHPNILDVFDAGVDDSTCYIVMEYIEGGNTLKRHCRVKNLLPIDVAVEIIFLCAKALDYAHRQGVIHRDIKPSNILLSDDKDVKIADFSIAHINRQDASQTMPMGFVGSPRYMSPEQVQEDFISGQTDLFSLGVVLYELVTGRHPFEAESFSALIHRVINEDPLPLSHYRAGVPEELETVMQRALAKDPQQRYRSGVDMASDLSSVFGHLEKPKDDMKVKEKFNVLKDLEFFQGFTDNEIWEIIRASVWEDFPPGREIISEGDFGDSFYIIASGEVRVLKSQRLVGLLRPGDCFGEMGYINKTKRTATIMADGHVTVLRVNSTLIEQVSKDCQLRFCKVFLRTLIQRLSKTTDLMIHN